MFIFSRRIELALAAAALVLLLAALGVWYLTPSLPRAVTAEGVALQADFELLNHEGEPVTEADFAGDYMLAYFGYTYCPDVCPLSLQAMMAAYDALPEGVRERVRPVFFTVDPERDTVPAIADYVSLFGPELTGLTGTREQVDAAAKSFRVYHGRAQQDTASNDYLVDHSSFTYLMGPDGGYVAHFGHDADPETIAAGVAEAVRS